jgi:hypothetical protein
MPIFRQLLSAEEFQRQFNEEFLLNSRKQIIDLFLDNLPKFALHVQGFA